MNNKFSGYFDQNFNFNNIVQQQNTSDDRLNNMICDNNIMLEPRFQEYLKKNRYYKDNNIEPTISAEKEFQITNVDLRLLRSFLNGNKKVYNKKVYNKLNESKTQSKPSFPSSKFKDDKRVPKIEKSKTHFNQPQNKGMFVPDKHERHYDDVVKPGSSIMMDSRDFPEYVYQGNGFDSSATRFNPRLDPKIDPGHEDKNKYESQFRIPPNPYKRENRDSRKESKVDLYRGIDPRNNQIISDLSDDDFDLDNNYSTVESEYNNSSNSRYGNDQMPSYSSASEMDFDHKVVIPNMASRSKKDLSNGNYRFEPYYGKGALRNSDLESDLVRGMPSSRVRNRSYGYRNPDENYFDYIDEDFRYDSVEPWERGGLPTRLENKSLAKNREYKRDIM